MSADKQPSTESDDDTAPKPKPGQPLFSGPATPTQAVRANGRPVTQLFSQPDRPAPQQPAADLPLGES